MKMQLLALATAVSLAAGGLAQAAPDREVVAFLDRVQTTANARLAEAGIDYFGPPVAIRATVDGDGRLFGVHVMRSSGSPAQDRAIERALASMRVNGTPYELLGANVTLVFDHKLADAQ